MIRRQLMRQLPLWLLLSLLLVPRHLPAQLAPSALDSAYQPLKWRSIGPFRGVRSVAASGVVGNDKV